LGNENPIEVVIDTEGLKKDLVKTIEDKFEGMRESLTPREQTQSLTEGKPAPVEFDYRVGIVEALSRPRGRLSTDSGIGAGKVAEDLAVITKDEKTGEHKYSLNESLTESIGTIATDNCCIPSIWADKIERDHVYPGSVFLGAWFVNWYTEIQGKPGDSVVVCKVGPATCTDLGCDEPATTAAEITCGTISLEHDVCAYAICKNTMDLMQTGVVDALNEGLGSCLAVCVDNYFFNVALSCTNAGTLTSSGAMTGSLIAEAMGSMEAGNRCKWIGVI